MIGKIVEPLAVWRPFGLERVADFGREVNPVAFVLDNFATDARDGEAVEQIANDALRELAISAAQRWLAARG